MQWSLAMCDTLLNFVKNVKMCCIFLLERKREGKLVSFVASDSSTTFTASARVLITNQQTDTFQ